MYLGFEHDLVKKLKDVQIALLTRKVFSKKDEDRRDKHESVIHCVHADIGHEIPAGIPSPGLRRVHDIIGNEKGGLQEFCAPAEDC